MSEMEIWAAPKVFSEKLFEKMCLINRGLEDLEMYEFRYALNNVTPALGWAAITLDPPEEIEKRIKSTEFFNSIQIKPRVNGSIVLDPTVLRLTQMLFVGLVTGQYSTGWVNACFYFDIRGFNFLARIQYETEPVKAHLGGRPWVCFQPHYSDFEHSQEVGYKAFKTANAEIDAAFIRAVQKLIAKKGTPIVMAIAGPTAAGKTEIVDQLNAVFSAAGQKVSSIEMDNFLTDRDYREEKGINSLGAAAIHLELFLQGLKDIMHGHKIYIPRYDFIDATSSHDLSGHLKPGCTPIEIEPADIIFIEGNFPFLLPEVAGLIGIKVVYLTDDSVRLKRKWKRDIDLRKKYDPYYLRNRFFKDQFLMTEKCYLPQLEACDIYMNTTGAAMWVTPEVARMLADE